MLRIAGLVVVVVIVAGALGACVKGIPTVRTGNALPVAAGEPQNECERDGMLELVPARSFAHDESVGGGLGGMYSVTSLDSEQQGVALYTRKGRGPLPLLETLPSLGEPELERLHAQRIESVHDKMVREVRFRRVVGTGLMASLVVGGLLAFNDSTQVEGVAVMGGAALVGLVAIPVMLWLRPTPLEHNYHDMRAHLLVDGEDDREAATRGVDRFNESVRARCR